MICLADGPAAGSESESELALTRSRKGKVIRMECLRYGTVVSSMEMVTVYVRTRMYVYMLLMCRR